MSRSRVLMLLAGAPLFVGLFFVLASFTPKSQAASDSQVGRYQIVTSQVRCDVRLLDTVTGQTWTRIQYSDLPNQPAIWKLEDRANTDAELRAWWTAEKDGK